MEKIIDGVGKKLGRRITTRCNICKNDSTYNINDVPELISMFKLAISLAKKEVFDDINNMIYLDRGICCFPKKKYFELKKKYLQPK